VYLIHPVLIVLVIYSRRTLAHLNDFDMVSTSEQSLNCMLDLYVFIISLFVHYKLMCSLYVYVFIISLCVHYKLMCSLYVYVFIISLCVHYKLMCSL